MDFKYEIHSPVPLDLWPGLFQVGTVTFGEQVLPVMTYEDDERCRNNIVIGYLAIGEPPVPAVITNSWMIDFMENNSITGPMLAHEIGHWVNGDMAAALEKGSDLERHFDHETAADRYAADIYGRTEMTRALRTLLSASYVKESVRELELRIAALSA